MTKQTGVTADPLRRAGALGRRMLRHFSYAVFCLRRIGRETGDDYRRFRAALDAEGANQTAQNQFAAWVRWIAARAWNLARRAALVVWRKISNVVAYYISRADAFRGYVTEYFEGLQDPKQRQIEVRISPGMNFAAARYARGRWKVEMPELCFVCGAATNRPPLRRFVRLEDVAGPFWCVALGVIGGLLLSFSRWSPWFLVIGTVGGFLLGHECRRYVDVLITYSRCSRHAEPSTPPAMRVFGDQLIVSVSNKSVRLDLRQSDASRAEARNRALSETVIVPEPERIPLADSTDTPIIPERTIPLASDDPEDPHRGLL